jgi:signal transduction histidine kinase
MQSIFFNLIQNSIKYKHPLRKPVIHITSNSDESYITITFSDNGIGIDLQKFKEKVFGLYKRFHTHIDGRGMGLFLVKNQVEAMKGTISIDSIVDTGTVFTVTIPKSV